jgi:hypothetical protein
MPELLKAKIDLAKIHGARVVKKGADIWLKLTDAQLFEGQNGALYLDAALFPSPGDKFGNSHRITQDLPKAIRDSGVERGPILGNAKTKAYGQGSPAPAQRPAPAPQTDIMDEDVPF